MATGAQKGKKLTIIQTTIYKTVLLLLPFEQRVGVRNLGDISQDGSRHLLPLLALRQVLEVLGSPGIAAVSADLARVYTGQEVDGSQGSFGPIHRRDLVDSPVTLGAIRVMSVEYGAIDGSRLAHGDGSALRTGQRSQ
jgi:hypothetical protein